MSNYGLRFVAGPVIILVLKCAAGTAAADDRPPQPCLKGIKSVRTLVKLDLDDASKQAFALSTIKFQSDLQQLLNTAGYTISPDEKHVTVVWAIKLRKFEPQVATNQARNALAGLFVFEAQLSVQQDVVFVRPEPVLPGVLVPAPLDAFIANADTWRESEGGFGLPILIQSRLSQVLEAKVDLLFNDWKGANNPPTALVEARTRAVGSTADKITASAASHQDETKYGATGAVTRCSEFVRDVVQDLLQQSRPELQGQVKDQFDLLSASASWQKLKFADDNPGVFAQAHDLAQNGEIVVVAWKNPSPTATDTGHIAIVVPGSLDDSETWRMKVPTIAQAGRKNPRGVDVEMDKSVFSALKLSWGFSRDKATGMEFFKYVGSP